MQGQNVWTRRRRRQPRTGWMLACLILVACTQDPTGGTIEVSPDLVPTNLSGPSVVAPGDAAVSIAVDVENVGQTSAGGSFSVRFYLSTNTTISSSDLEIADVRVVTSIPASDYFPISAFFNVPSSLSPGSYYLGVIVDADDEIDESDDSNNDGYLSSALTVSAGIPDLVPIAAVGPTSAFPGDPITVDVTVRNQGAGPTSGSWDVQLYLSTNTIISSNDLLLTQYSTSQVIQAAGQDFDTRATSLPGGLAAGLYFYGLLVNSTGTLGESDYSNNSQADEHALVVGGPAPTPVPNGSTASGLALAAGSDSYYVIDVPAGRTSLQVSTAGGPGDADLYVTQGRVTGVASQSCSSVSGSSTENCTFTSPGAGPWYIRLNAYTSFSGVSLSATYQ